MYTFEYLLAWTRFGEPKNDVIVGLSFEKLGRNKTRFRVIFQHSICPQRTERDTNAHTIYTRNSTAV